MATKDDLSFLTDRIEPSGKNDRYLNINLNQNFKSLNVSSVKSYSKSPNNGKTNLHSFENILT